MSSALIYAEDWEHIPELLSTSAALGLNPLLIFSHSDLIDIEVAAKHGASEIITHRLEPIPTYISRLLVQIVSERQPRIILGEAKKNVREVFGRAAQRMSKACVNNCNSIEIVEDVVRIIRTVLGGGYHGIQELIGSPVFVTIRPEAFKKYSVKSIERPLITEIDLKLKQDKIKLVDKKTTKRSNVDLSLAKVVIGVGRGFRKKEDLRLAEELAELINGVIGCSRPISSDLKWLPEDRHIGLSGKWIRSRLYISIGISGQIQHAVGIKNAETVIAINKDPDAPIHKESDYSIIANLYEFLPILIKKLRDQITK